MKQLASIDSPPIAPRPPAQPAVRDAPGSALDHPDLLPGLSIVMACRDDAATVAAAIRNAADAASRVSYRHEILVVDDGSTDLSAERAAPFVTGDGHVQLLLHPHPRGSGEALRAGIAVARNPWVVLTDAAFELDLCQLEDFLALAPDHDLLIGWRVLRRAPVRARLRAAVWSGLVSRRLGVPVRDVDCPLKLVRRDLLERVTLTRRGSTLGAELLARACAQGARVTEVAVRQRPDVPAAAVTSIGPHLGARNLGALAAMSRPRQRRSSASPRPRRRPWRAPGAAAVAVAAVFAGLGWLYLLFKAGLVGWGPDLGGALPLQQLAGSADQPVVRLAAAWLPAGAIVGVVLARLTSWRHPGVVAGVIAALLLTLTGAASDAVANSQALAPHLLAQLGHPGLIASVLLMAAAVAVASHLTRARGQ